MLKNNQYNQNIKQIPPSFYHKKTPLRVFENLGGQTSVRAD